MRRRRLVTLVAAASLSAGADACSTDTFGADAGDASMSNPQADFCDAEAHYFTHCNIMCQSALTNCGLIYSGFAPGVAAAYANCANMDRLACTTDFLSLINEPCMQSQLSGFANDSGALVKLAGDYCKSCGLPEPQCSATFAQNPNVGYVSSLFDDSLINNVDKTCTKPDAGIAIGTDASACTGAFGLCEVLTIGVTFPYQACKD
jgi:hypothetical protein